MTSKILTVVPLLILSGLFFAAGIIEAGILFLAFGAVMLSAYLRARLAITEEEASDTETRTTPVPGAPRRGINGG